jgi:hypothetical protein
MTDEKYFNSWQRQKNFSSPKGPDCLWGLGTRAHSLGADWLEYEADYLPSSAANVTNAQAELYFYRLILNVYSETKVTVNLYLVKSDRTVVCLSKQDEMCRCICTSIWGPVPTFVRCICKIANATISFVMSVHPSIHPSIPMHVATWFPLDGCS